MVEIDRIFRTFFFFFISISLPFGDLAGAVLQSGAAQVDLNHIPYTKNHFQYKKKKKKKKRINHINKRTIWLIGL